VLVAIDPLVLEGALAFLLERLDIDVVVRLHDAPADALAGRFDAAVVTGAFSDPAPADVTITLPDLEADDGREPFAGAIRLGRGSEPEIIEIRDQDAVIDLLDRHVPAVAARSERLRGVRRTP
jgi:hypothetical protein